MTLDEIDLAFVKEPREGVQIAPRKHGSIALGSVQALAKYLEDD